MEKRALLVGIDSYDNFPQLTGCVNDVTELLGLLEKHYDGTPNYDCRVLTSPGPKPVVRSLFRKSWYELFADFSGDVLFYFSGHGKTDLIGGYLCLEDSSADDPGVSFNDLLQMVNQSIAREVLIIMDTCFGFFAGRLPRFRNAIAENCFQLREGVTLIGGAQPTKKAMENNGRGVFSRLLTDALAGGGADIRGYVTAASAYAHAEQLLGAWEQRPIFLSNVSSFSPIRRCKPLVSDVDLKELTIWFPEQDSPFNLNAHFNSGHEAASKKKAQVMKKLELYHNARLVESDKNGSLFMAALNSGCAKLTPSGKFYWNLAKRKRF